MGMRPGEGEAALGPEAAAGLSSLGEDFIQLIQTISGAFLILVSSRQRVGMSQKSKIKINKFKNKGKQRQNSHPNCK